MAASTSSTSTASTVTPPPEPQLPTVKQAGSSSQAISNTVSPPPPKSATPVAPLATTTPAETHRAVVPEPLNPYPGPYYTPNCGMDPINGGTNRDTVFHATDASKILFISDQSIHDQIAVGSKSILIPKRMTGWLYFPNGRKYRVDNGAVSSIVDRNGNTTSISSSASPIGITDPLNRYIHISVGGSPGRIER